MCETIMDEDREADLHAYIDNELPPERRIAFEAFLAANPSAAARVHDYLHQREALRCGMELIAGPTPDRTAGLADRLYHRLRLDLIVRRFGPIAAAILLLAGGWNVGVWVQQQDRAAWAAVPAFADEAAEAHSATLSRPPPASSVSPAELTAMAEVLAHHIGGNAPINLPDAGASLVIVRAAVVPWHDGSALQFVYREPDGELLTLFVAVAEPVEDLGLHAIEQNGLQLVYWRKGAVAYTVAGSKTDSDLLLVAKRMADSVRRS